MRRREFTAAAVAVTVGTLLATPTPTQATEAARPAAIPTVSADSLRKLLGASMVAAIEKLMGLVLTAIAVEMILAGLKRYFLEP